MYAACGLDDLGVAVTDVHHTDAAGKIDKLIALHIFENRAITRLDVIKGNIADTIGNVFGFPCS